MTIEQEFRHINEIACDGSSICAPFDRSAIISSVLKQLRNALNANVCTVFQLIPGSQYFSALPNCDDVPGVLLPASLLDELNAAGLTRQLQNRLHGALLRAPTRDYPALLLILDLADSMRLNGLDHKALSEAQALLHLLFTPPTAVSNDGISAQAADRQDDAQDVLNRLTEAQALVVDLINEMLQAPFDRLDKTIDKAFAQLGEFCGSDRTYLFVETDATTMSNTHEWCADGITPMKNELQDVPRDMAEMWWSHFDTIGHVYIEDVSELEAQSDLRAILEMQGIISLLAVPLRIDGKLVGFMGFDSVRMRRSFLPAEIYLLKSVANVIATLLSRHNDEKRTRTERQRREAEQRKLQATLRALPDILVELDPDLRITGIHANPQIVLPIQQESLLGYTVEQCLPRHISALAKDIVAELQGKDIAMGYRCAFHTNETQRWYSISAAKRESEDASGRYGYVAVVRDTTESYMQRLEIERLSTIARNSTNLILITDPSGLIEWVNPAFEHRTGYLLHEIQGMSPGQLLQCSLTDPETVAQIREAILREKAITCEILNQTKHGELYWVELAIQPIFDECGVLTGFMSVQTDMTQQRLHARAMERALAAEKEAREQLKSAVSIMQDAFIQFDKDQKLVLCNEQYLKIFDDLADVLYPGNTLRNILSAAVKAGYNKVEDGRIEAWLDREIKAFHLKHSATRNLSIRGRWYRHVQQRTPDGGRISLLSDITDLKDAERRALADRARAMDASRDGIVLLSDTGHVNYANPAATRMFGYQQGQELTRRHLEDIVRIKPQAASGNLDLRDALKRAAWTGEVYATDVEGRRVEIEIAISRNDENTILCILRDQTEKLKLAAEKENLREAFALAQRREEMGQVAAGLTHDFNNYLAVISSAATLIEEAGELESRSLATRINDTVAQASVLVRRLMDLGKNRKPEKAYLDLRKPVRDAVSLVCPGLPSSIHLDMVLPDAPVMFVADTMSVVQVVMNLCINARDAISDASIRDGKISVVLRDAVPEDQSLDFQVGIVDQTRRYVCLSIEDNGPGITTEAVNNVFTPYFSTKGDRGTGLGLQIVASAVEAHSAALALDTSPGNGTRFTILWPVPSDAELREISHLGQNLGEKSILILGTGADRELGLARDLEASGALVATCVDIEDALFVLSEDLNSWDAVIFDPTFLPEIREMLWPGENLGHDMPSFLCWTDPDAPDAERRMTQEVGRPWMDFPTEGMAPLPALAALFEYDDHSSATLDKE